MTRGLRLDRAANPGRGELTLTMAACLERLRAHGELVRMPGGYWVRQGVKFSGSYPAEAWDGTTTVEALVRRGLAEYSQWQPGRGGKRFPIAVKPT